jgi:hypothetical protein
MIANSKLNCITDLSASLRRTAGWRRELQKKYSDHRNQQAAETLDKLAGETNDLTDEAWLELKPYYNWASGTWSEAVSLAARHVEFRSVRTFPDFVNRLVDILSQDSVAA